MRRVALSFCFLPYITSLVGAWQGVPIRSLPKTRELWREVDVTTWTKRELDAACALLDLPMRGKKRDLLARIQDWVLEPELLAQRRRQQEQDLERDAVLGQSACKAGLDAVCSRR